MRSREFIRRKILSPERLSQIIRRRTQDLSDRRLNYNNPKRTIVITGSSGGIGAAIALELASENTNIIINYNKNKNPCNSCELQGFIIVISS